MSLGATMSAPARAWLTAIRPSSSTDASLSTVPPASQHAAVAVARVLAEADVGDHEQLRDGGLERPDRQLDRPVLVPGARPGFVLLGRQPEQEHGGHSEGRQLARLDHGLGHREPLDARHRRDGRPAVQPLGDEQRRHQRRRAQLGLPHEVAQRAGPAQPAKPSLWECHWSSHGTDALSPVRLLVRAWSSPTPAATASGIRAEPVGNRYPGAAGGGGGRHDSRTTWRAR